MYGPISDGRVSPDSRAHPPDRPAALRGRRLRLAEARADADPAAGGAVPDRRDRAHQQAVRRGAAELPQDRRAAPELVARAAGAVPHRRDVLPRGRVRQGGARIRRLPVVLPAPPDRRPHSVPTRDELLRSAQAGRAGPGPDAEGAGSVQETRQGVPAEPLLPRRALEDRRLSGAARPEGALGGVVLLQSGQSERGAPAARAGSQGLPTNSRDSGNALPARRGELLRGQEGRGGRGAPPPAGGGRGHRGGAAGGRAAPGPEGTRGTAT